MAAVVAERGRGGPFRGPFDFAERVGAKAANKRQLENLIRAGAFDSLDRNRRRLFEGVETLLRLAGAAERERDTNQTSLFGGETLLPAQRAQLPPVDDWPAMERLNHEFDAVGFYLSAHPLDAYGHALERLGVMAHDRLTPAAAGSRPKLVGVVVAKRERTSAKGNRFAFVQLSDSHGVFEVVIFSEVLAASRALLDSGRPLLLTCELRTDGEGIRLNAQSVEDLDQAVARSGRGLKVHLDRPDALAALQRAVAAAKRGRGRLSLVLDIDEAQSVEIALPGAYAISAEMRAAIGAVPGVIGLHDI
jgi:DNA polymerase-3 subunit alpha